MAQKSNVWCGQLRLASFLAIGSAIAFSGDSTFAQIAPDGTLPNNSIVTPSGNTSVIQGGTQVGTNLFHSFAQFSVLKGNTAHFNNAGTIQNIFTRVTGGSASSIDGVIKANGTANVFLLNPNGIIFGPNARLDIRGSFLASTASRLNFADGTQFSAIAPQSTPLLTISVPIGLQFGGTAGGIRVQGSSLKVQPGKTLALVGGDVTLQGGKLADSQEPNLASPGGRIELGSVAGIGEVSLNQRGNSWVLGYDSVNTFKDIRLEDRAFVDASGSGGGDIQIQGAQLDLTQRSAIFADTEGTGSGGQVLVHTNKAVTLKDGSRITADVLQGKTGTGGDVTIETGQLSIQGNGSLIRTDTNGKRQGGNLTVRASNSVELDGRKTGLYSQTEDAGDAGNLTITTRRLSVSNGAVVSTSTYAKGKGGILSVTASDSVELGGDSGLFSQTQGAGDAGNLTIDTRRLSVFDGAQVSSKPSTSTRSQSGLGANLSVTASDSVELMGSSANDQSPSGLFTQTQGAQNAGNITIKTRQLNVGNGAQVSATTSGQGKGGEIRVNAFDSVNLFGVGSNKTGSGLFTRTTVQGQGGNIFVETRAFRVADNAVVDARTIGEGTGGNITVKANTFEAVNGGQILASAFKGSNGSAGKITLNTTDSVTISGSAPFKRLVGIGRSLVEDESATSGLFVLSRGSGNAGNLELTARSIRLDNLGEVSAETASGQGGDIKLQAQDLLLLHRNSKISTTAGGSGNGGNIIIDTPFIIAAPLENSDITANAYNGQGGKITINATGIYGMVQRSRQDLERLHVEDLNPRNLLTNDITAFSQQNPTFSGIIQINTPDVDPSRGLLQLPTNLVDVSQQIDTSCNSGSRQRKGSFTVTGRGGLPSSPYEMLTPKAVVVDWVTLNPSSDNRNSPSVTKKPTHPTPEPIVEATGWIRNAKGEVVLIANAPTVTPHSPQLTPASCDDR